VVRLKISSQRLRWKKKKKKKKSHALSRRQRKKSFKGGSEELNSGTATSKERKVWGRWRGARFLLRSRHRLEAGRLAGGKKVPRGGTRKHVPGGIIAESGFHAASRAHYNPYTDVPKGKHHPTAFN